MALFKPAEISEIEAAVSAVEARSSGEIVIVVLPSSDTYDKTCALASFGVTALAALALSFARSAPLPEDFLIIQLLLCYIAWTISQWHIVKKYLLTSEQRINACRRRAYQLFSQLGVYRTKERSGVLLLISELERQIVILGDEGISKCLGDKSWQQRLDKLIEGIHHDVAKESVLDLIHSLGDIFAERFPRHDGDINELSDTVVQHTEN